MRFTTKIVDYNGKAMIKLPRKFSKALGIKPGDEYTTTLTPEKQIFIKFLRPLLAPLPLHEAK